MRSVDLALLRGLDHWAPSCCQSDLRHFWTHLFYASFLFCFPPMSDSQSSSSFNIWLFMIHSLRSDDIPCSCHWQQGVIIFHDVFDNTHNVGGAQIRVEGVYIWPFRQLRMVANRWVSLMSAYRITCSLQVLLITFFSV